MPAVVCHGPEDYRLEERPVPRPGPEEVVVRVQMPSRDAHLGPGCYPIAIDMIQKGLLPMDRIVTHRLPLERFQDGIDLVAAGDRSIKVMLQP